MYFAVKNKVTKDNTAVKQSRKKFKAIPPVSAYLIRKSLKYHAGAAIVTQITAEA